MGGWMFSRICYLEPRRTTSQTGPWDRRHFSRHYHFTEVYFPFLEALLLLDRFRTHAQMELHWLLLNAGASSLECVWMFKMWMLGEVADFSGKHANKMALISFNQSQSSFFFALGMAPCCSSELVGIITAFAFETHELTHHLKVCNCDLFISAVPVCQRVCWRGDELNEYWPPWSKIQ